MQLLVLLLILLVSPATLAQFSFDRPDLKAGESWTFLSKLTGESPTGQSTSESKFTREITERESNRYAVKVFQERDGKIEPLSSAGLTHDLNRLRSVRGEISDSGWFQFPLVDGKSWHAKELWPDGRGYSELTYTVAGTEQITVVSGKFDTVKIVGKGRWFNTATNASDVIECTIWYAPIAKGIARFHERRWFQGRIGLDAFDELLSYSLVN
jgi:hypothetical protein